MSNIKNSRYRRAELQRAATSLIGHYMTIMLGTFKTREVLFRRQMYLVKRGLVLSSG